MPRTGILTLALVLIGLALFVATAVLAASSSMGWGDLVTSYTLTNSVFGFGFLLSGAVIAWFHPRNAVGWLLVACGLGHLTTPAAGIAAVTTAADGWPELITRSLASISVGGWLIGVAGLFPLVLLLFPDGHLPSRRWRPVAWLAVFNTIYGVVVWTLADEGPTPGRATTSILSVGLVLPLPVQIVGGLLGLSALLFAIAALVVRYARGTELVRRQLMWVILAVVAMLVINAQRFVLGDGPVLLLLAFALVPVAIAIAIVRHGLLDIRLVVSRTVLYILAIGTLIAVYAAIVAGVSLVVPRDAGRVTAIVAAVVVAVGFNPLIVILRKVIDRAFYGSRADPAETAVRLGDGLREAGDLGEVINNARASLRLPYLGLSPHTGSPISSGDPDVSMTTEMPLTYRNESVGRLVVGLRRGETALHDDDRRALRLIASPLTVALHAMALTDQVRAARTAVIEAREQEMVRLQRNLHDGLGPALTSVALNADATFNLVRSDPGAAERMLLSVRSDIRSALDDVRRVVSGLRPVELHAQGLASTLRQRTRQPAVVNDRVVEFSVEASGLHALTPAIELAAFRIAMEGIANVLKHSDATRCVISLTTADAALGIVVADNGTSRQWAPPGVGMHSIAERAEELGGTASSRLTAEGGRLEARIPLGAT